MEQLRIRNADDALKVFYAVHTGVLPLVTRRLNEAERDALRPGCVYVWEKDDAAAPSTAPRLQRFTEGRKWGPSRIRDVRGGRPGADRAHCRPATDARFAVVPLLLRAEPTKAT